MFFITSRNYKVKIKITGQLYGCVIVQLYKCSKVCKFYIESKTKNIEKAQETHREAKKQFSKEQVENVDLYKPVLNNIIIKRKQWVNQDFGAPLIKEKSLYVFNYSILEVSIKAVYVLIS